MNIEIPEQAVPPSLKNIRTAHVTDMIPKVPLKRFQEPQKTLEQFIQENNLQKLYQDEQYEVFDLYKDIKEALKDNTQTREPLAIGRLSQY